ncbi:MAG: Gldg family protein [Planctomycetota bacterium]
MKTKSDSQGQRRAKYGLNVTVAIIVALALVVVINALVDWQVRRLPIGAKSWLRYDLTATRAYTLAPQTVKVLSELDEPVAVTAILRVDDKNGQDVADLLDEYAQASSRFELDTIDPDRDAGRLEAYYRQLEDRFAEETSPVRTAVGAGLETLGGLIDNIAAVRGQAQEITADPELTDAKLRQEFQLLANKLGEIEAAYINAQQQLTDALAQPLPAWSNARLDLLNAFRKADAEVFTPFSREFARRAKNRNAPLGVRDLLLRMESAIDSARQPLRQATQDLTAPPTPARYDRLLASLRTGEVIVLLNADRERVVPVAEMFTTPTADEPARFVGEDRLTGTLSAMQIDQPPMVVFVHDLPVGITNPRSGFSHVISRLATIDFVVEEWPVGSNDNPRSGQTAAAKPPPEPAAGQRAVWIVPGLSLERVTQTQRERIAALFEKRLAEGDGVMVCFGYDPEAEFRSLDPLAELAGSWGLVPRSHQLLLYEGLSTEGRAASQADWLISDWPSRSPLSDALAGREVQFVAPTPIDFQPQPRVETQTLIELDQPKVWAETGLTSQEEIAAARYSQEAAVGQPVVAATSERRGEQGRLMAFTERYWLTDRQAGRRLGNSELFVNSVYWLAGLDEAIAATPRSQDLRRVEALSDGQQLAYRLLLLAGLPGLSLLAGGAVWSVRRRG